MKHEGVGESNLTLEYADTQTWPQSQVKLLPGNHFLPGPSASHSAALFVDVGRASPGVCLDKHRGREAFSWRHYLLVNNITEKKWGHKTKQNQVSK